MVSARCFVAILMAAMLLAHAPAAEPSDKVRALLVDDMITFIGDERATQRFLDFIDRHNFTELTFYTGGPEAERIIPRWSDQLSAIIDRARCRGVKTIGIAVGGEAEMDRVVRFASNYNIELDALWLEYEYWNHQPRDFSRALEIIRYMRARSDEGTLVGAYIGWPTQDEVQTLAGMVDRVYIHAYTRSVHKTFDYIRERVDFLGAHASGQPRRRVKVMPIFSVEWRPKGICDGGRGHPEFFDHMCFMGPHLREYGFDGIEAEFEAARDREQRSGGTGLKARSARQDAVDFIGYYFFAYSFARDALAE